jgi:imidazolonepropionase-like amidohydrolase
MKFRFSQIFRVLLLTIIGLMIQLPFAQNPVFAANQTPAPTTSILFKNVRVFDGFSNKLSEPANVLVVGEKINTITAASIVTTTTKPSPGLTQIDGNGRILMPGLIDNHVHIYMGASSRGELLGEGTTPGYEPEKLQARATAAAEEMLLRGFTTVRDVGGPVFELKKSIDKGELTGPRIYPSGATISQTSGHGDFRGLDERSRRFGGKLSRAEELGATFIADGRDEVLTATRENLRMGATQIKLMAGGGAASLYDPLDVTEYTLDEMSAAVEAAADWGTYVTVHAYTPKAVRRAIKAGVKCIEHGQLLDEKTMDTLSKKGIWLSLQALDPAPENADPIVKVKKQQIVDGTKKAFEWAIEHKVNLAWGTDFLFTPQNNKNQNADIPKLLEWFKPYEALKIVTSENARLLTLSGERNTYPGKLGVIEQGAYADLLLVEGNPLENLSVVVDYVNNFKVIVKNGKIYKNTT